MIKNPPEGLLFTVQGTRTLNSVDKNRRFMFVAGACKMYIGFLSLVLFSWLYMFTCDMLVLCRFSYWFLQVSYRFCIG